MTRTSRSSVIIVFHVSNWVVNTFKGKSCGIRLRRWLRYVTHIVLWFSPLLLFPDRTNCTSTLWVRRQTSSDGVDVVSYLSLISESIGRCDVWKKNSYRFSLMNKVNNIRFRFLIKMKGLLGFLLILYKGSVSDLCRKTCFKLLGVYG